MKLHGFSCNDFLNKELPEFLSTMRVWNHLDNVEKDIYELSQDFLRKDGCDLEFKIAERDDTWKKNVLYFDYKFRLTQLREKILEVTKPRKKNYKN